MFMMIKKIYMLKLRRFIASQLNFKAARKREKNQTKRKNKKNLPSSTIIIAKLRF